MTARRLAPVSLVAWASEPLDEAALCEWAAPKQTHQARPKIHPAVGWRQHEHRSLLHIKRDPERNQLSSSTSLPSTSSLGPPRSETRFKDVSLPRSETQVLGLRGDTQACRASRIDGQQAS